MRNERCILCDEEIKEIYPNWTEVPPFYAGGKVKIDAGFGSRHDCEDFTGFICDPCIDKLLRRNLIKRD
jgi:hypothetical protein